jgi:hypothetical protein
VAEGGVAPVLGPFLGPLASLAISSIQKARRHRRQAKRLLHYQQKFLLDPYSLALAAARDAAYQASIVDERAARTNTGRQLLPAALSGIKYAFPQQGSRTPGWPQGRTTGGAGDVTSIGIPVQPGLYGDFQQLLDLLAQLFSIFGRRGAAKQPQQPGGYDVYLPPQPAGAGTLAGGDVSYPAGYDPRVDSTRGTWNYGGLGVMPNVGTGSIWGALGAGLGQVGAQLLGGLAGPQAMPGGAPIFGIAGGAGVPALSNPLSMRPAGPRGRAIVVMNGRAYRSLGTPIAWSGDLAAVKRLRRAAARIGHVIPHHRSSRRFR